jgi:hypothetical protein
MPSEHFERYRKRLEDQLRTDMGLLYEAYLAKLRAFQAVERLRGNAEGLENAGVDPLTLAEFSPYLPPVPTAAVPMAAPAAAPPRSEPLEVAEAVEAALSRLPEEFDRFDVLAALDFEPGRSTLYAVLNTLVLKGVLTIVREAGGKRPALYRKAGTSVQSPGD